MNKKRALSLLLVCVIVLPLILTLFSCKKEEEDLGPTATLDLGEYNLVYGSTSNGTRVTQSFQQEIANFATRLSAATGVEFIAESEERTESDPNSPEILIGTTSRSESIEAEESIEGYGYVIAVKGNKIVIVGSNALLTLHALDIFSENYLCGSWENGEITLDRETREDEMEMLEIVSSASEMSYAMVYEEGLDTAEGNVWGEPGTNNDYDFPYMVLLKTLDKLKKISKRPEREFVKMTDGVPQREKEIIFGRADRDEVTAALAQMDPDGYGVFTQNGHLVLTAWSDSGLSALSKLFLDLIDDATVREDDGTVRVLFPANLSLTGVMKDNWVTDFPKPEGAELYNTQDAGDDSLQYLYIGEGVSAEAFHAYCDTLKAQGYERLGEENEIEQSLFATFVHEEKQQTLYVAYNAFTHAAGNYKYKPRLKVISASLDAVNLPGEELLTPNPTYTKKTDSVISSVYLENSSVGMCYVIMLEDGTFIVFDGGADGSGSIASRIYSTLSAMHNRANPGSTDPIRIRTWFVTHSHGDHYEAFGYFLSNYVKPGYAKLDYVMGNYPAGITVYNGAGTDMVLSNSINEMAMAYGFEYIKIHTGQRYYFANLEIEVLCTQEDLNPMRISLFNDVSSTVRFTMKATDAQGNPVNDPAATTTSIWTGDAFIYSSRFMSGMYGTYLKSDMVQVAHHGNIGCEKPFYGFIEPTVVWFPNTYTAYRSYTGGWRSDWQSQVDYYLVKEIGSVKYVYVSDSRNVALKLTASGPDYANIFNPGNENNKLSYGTRWAIEIQQ